MSLAQILDGLNEQQRQAVEAVRGPVCILAGAGTGKTTTITRRIAYQVATGTFRPTEILAVTFTDKAAGELRERLESLGAHRVQARTFHSAALAQLRHFRPAGVGRILPSKALVLRNIANALPRPYRFRPAGDLASEIERAKSRRVAPGEYEASIGVHEPPIPADLMARVYRSYEALKAERGLVDFDDLLELAVRLYEEDGSARAVFRERYRAFTVDEYQDVNELQQALLDLWLGDRDDLCAVGDDYQSIYAFTGASPAHLLRMPDRFRAARVVRLEENYRSSPQVLEVANRLVPSLAGAEKRLVATRPAGPEVTARPYASGDDECAALVEACRGLHAAGVPLEEMAVLCRTNARLADFEEAFHAAGIPCRGAALLSREAARRLLRRLGRGEARNVAATVRELATAAGWTEPPPDGLGEREQTRQVDLTRLVRVAEELDDGERTCADYAAELERRFGGDGSERRGVNLLTLHAAKGLEFDAVFLPRLEEKELPVSRAQTPEAVAEERRLLYVGLTRARRELRLSWVRTPSRFLLELGVETRRAGTRPSARAGDGAEASPGFEALRAWRLRRAREDVVPPYVVFHNTTLEEIADRRPRSLAELGRVPGVGPAKLQRYGDEVLAVLAAQG